MNSLTTYSGTVTLATKAGREDGAGHGGGQDEAEQERQCDLIAYHELIPGKGYPLGARPGN